MKKISLIIGLAIMLGGMARSQDAPISNLYHFNMYLINPAAAGANYPGVMATLVGRYQWLGLEGAPKTAAFSFTNLIRNHHGIGLMVGHDSHGLMRDIGGQLSYAFHGKIDRERNTHIAIGGSVGFNQINFNYGMLDHERAFNLATETQFHVNANAGFLLHSENFYVGFSAYNLLPPKIGTDLVPTLLFAQIGFLTQVNRDWKLEPILVARANNFMDLQFDAGLKMHYRRNFWMGGSYRHLGTALIMGGYHVGNMTYGYATEWSFNSLMSRTYGTHEILISYRGAKAKGKPKKILCPAYGN